MATRRVVSLLVVVALLCSLAVGPILTISVDGQSASFVHGSPSDNRGDVIPITVHTRPRSDGEYRVAETRVLGASERLQWDDDARPQHLPCGRPESCRDGRGRRNQGNTERENSVGEGTAATRRVRHERHGRWRHAGHGFVHGERTNRGRSTDGSPHRKTDVSGIETPDDLRAAASTTDNGTIAKGDQFVLAVNVSGMSGFLERSMLDGSGEDVRVHFRESNPEQNTATERVRRRRSETTADRRRRRRALSGDRHRRTRHRGRGHVRRHVRNRGEKRIGDRIRSSADELHRREAPRRAGPLRRRAGRGKRDENRRDDEPRAGNDDKRVRPRHGCRRVLLAEDGDSHEEPDVRSDVRLQRVGIGAVVHGRTS